MKGYSNCHGAVLSTGRDSSPYFYILIPQSEPHSNSAVATAWKQFEQLPEVPFNAAVATLWEQLNPQVEVPVDVTVASALVLSNLQPETPVQAAVASGSA